MSISCQIIFNLFQKSHTTLATLMHSEPSFSDHRKAEHQRVEGPNHKHTSSTACKLVRPYDVQPTSCVLYFQRSMSTFAKSLSFLNQHIFSHIQSWSYGPSIHPSFYKKMIFQQPRSWEQEVGAGQASHPQVERLHQCQHHLQELHRNNQDQQHLCHRCSQRSRRCLH